MPTAASNLLPRYQFGDLTLDLGQRRVKRGEESLELGRLAFDFLRALVESSPNVVTYDDLAEKVWDGRPVSPEAIAQRAMVLRHALSDDADHPKYFEVLRSQGYRLIPDVSRVEAPEQRDRQRWGLAIAAGLITAVVVLVSVDIFLGGQPDILPNSVAVLPFENLSPDPDNAFFAAGIHEATLNQLAKISAINVIARTTMLTYANTEKSSAEIAQELNVQTVMEGSVQYVEGRVLVTAQLIDPQTNTHLWSESYARELLDVFSIQADIAERIAMALEAELLPSERLRIEKLPTASPAAYALYLRAIALFPNWITDPTTSFSTYPAMHEYLEEAVEIDPMFALAYARWAFVSYGPFAAVLAATAIELDPELALAHSAVASAQTWAHAYIQARQAHSRALELSPNDVEIIYQYAQFNSDVEQHEEAIRLIDRALQLDPDNPAIVQGAWEIYLSVPEIEKGITLLRQSLQLDANSVIARLILGRVLAGQGDRTQALEQLRIAEGLIPTDSYGMATLAHGYRLAGRPEDAERAFVSWQRTVADQEFPPNPNVRTWAYLAAGDRGQTLIALEEAADCGGAGPGLRFAKANTFFDPILEEPEFVEVRSRLLCSE